jgi:type II secretory ATPase GspE/PulE/Tfp pilus assembly ATPase PilB-like protein
MAQRLVRTVCSECKTTYEPNPDDLPADFHYEPGMQLARGEGCRKCRGTGYYGRAGIFELWTLEEPERERIMQRAPASDICRAAQQGGLRLLREDGWLKVRRGMTTPEEVTRTTKI